MTSAFPPPPQRLILRRGGVRAHPRQRPADRLDIDVRVVVKHQHFERRAGSRHSAGTGTRPAASTPRQAQTSSAVADVA